MPPVVGIVAGIALAGVGVATGVGFLVTTGLSLALGGLSQLLTPKPHQTPPVRNPLEFSMGGDEPRTWCYGKSATGGVVKYWECTGSTNEFLWFVVALQDTQAEAIDAMIVDNVTINFSGNAATNVFVNGASPRMWRYDHLGSPTQTVDSTFDAASTKWTSAHTLKGVCYVVWKLQYDETVYKNGRPDPLFVMRGRRLYDPRKDPTYGGTGTHSLSDETTWEHSSNAALCLFDYLKGVYLNGVRIGGCNVPIAGFNMARLIAAANVCDENVNLKAGGSEKRYTINGFVDAIEDKGGVVASMLLAMAGSLVMEGGLLCIDAGAAKTTVTFPANLADQWLAGAMTLNPTVTRQDKCNTITCLYAEPSQNYQAVTGPKLTVSAYVTADGGITLEKEIQHRFTTSQATVQRLNKLILANYREQLSFQATYKPMAIGVSAGNAFNWQSQSGGYSTMKMVCLKRSLNPSGSVLISARQETDAKYSWAESTEELPPPSFGTATGFVIPPAPAAPTGLVLNQIGNSVTAKWDEIPNSYITGYQILYGPQGGSVGTATLLDDNRRALDFTTTRIPPGLMTVYVRGVDYYGQIGTAASANITISAVPVVIRQNLLQIIVQAGYSTNLKLCLDIGDAGCYSGSGQTITDLTGNGNDFYRGTTSSAEASLDPTFHGVAGDLLATTYFQFDGTGPGSPYNGAIGGNRMKLSIANPSWLNGLHKSTGGLFSWLMVYGFSGSFDLTGFGSQEVLFTTDQEYSTSGDAPGTGSGPGVAGHIAWPAYGGKGEASHGVANGTGVGMDGFCTDSSDGSASWYIIGGSVHYNGLQTVMINEDIHSSIYNPWNSPSASNASTLELMPLITPGSKLAMFAMWDLDIGSAGLMQIRTGIKTLRPDFNIP